MDHPAPQRSAKDLRKATRARQRDQRKSARSQMTLMSHLHELKRRLFFAAIGIVLGAIIGWFLFNPVYGAIQQPLLDAAIRTGKPITVNFAGAATALDMRLKMSLAIGMIISSPWWIFQLWSFITPGLNTKERRYSYGFMGASIPLFFSGAYLAWWVLPRAVDILTDFVPEGATNLQDGQLYMSFVMRLVIAFGLAFTLPVILVGMNFLGFLSAETMINGWRWAIMIAFIFAAAMTPTPDVLTMLWVALPIIVLFFAAVGVAYIHDHRAKKAMAKLDAEAL